MSERPTVVLLGCFHQAQFLIPTWVENCWCQPSADFDRLVKTVVEEYGIRSVAEEATQAQDRISSAAAVAKAKEIPYENIDIPNAVQEQIKLHPEKGKDEEGRYVRHEGKNLYRIAWDLVREYHMYKTFLEFQKGQNPSLLICGAEHQSMLAVLLSQDFEVVQKTFDLPPPCAATPDDKS